jgi:hypothetical protein
MWGRDGDGLVRGWGRGQTSTVAGRGAYIYIAVLAHFFIAISHGTIFKN